MYHFNNIEIKRRRNRKSKKKTKLKRNIIQIIDSFVWEFRRKKKKKKKRKWQKRNTLVWCNTFFCLFKVIEK